MFRYDGIVSDQRDAPVKPVAQVPSGCGLCFRRLCVGLSYPSGLQRPDRRHGDVRAVRRDGVDHVPDSSDDVCFVARHLSRPRCAFARGPFSLGFSRGATAGGRASFSTMRSGRGRRNGSGIIGCVGKGRCWSAQLIAIPADIAVEQVIQVIGISEERLIQFVQRIKGLRRKSIDLFFSSRVIGPFNSTHQSDGFFDKQRRPRGVNRAQRVHDIGCETSAAVPEELSKSAVVDLCLQLPDGMKYPFLR